MPLHDPFDRSRLPGDFSREGRVMLLAQAAEALIDGRQPAPEAAMFLGAALHAWLRQGGNLQRDYLRTSGPERSRLTASRIFARCASTATAGDGRGTLRTITTPQASE